ncbi:MAG: hypothetical protein MJB14_18870 [Spirochaetes bacterium]|nr:hypothetical protein [Spirochaetota bacterium]
MRRLLSALKQDVIFQFRQGFYFVYLIVSIIYILILRFIPTEYRQIAGLFIIFSDPAVLGFLFIGGIILMEKGQRTLECLFVTPIRMKEYLIAKVISLSIIALITSFFILLFGVGLTFNPLSLIIAVILCSSFFILLGIPIAAQAESVNDYFFIAGPAMIPFWIPLIEYLGIVESPFFYLFPSKAALILVESIFYPVAVGEIIYGMTYLCFCTALVYIWARKWFFKYVVHQIGDLKCDI